MKSSDHKIFILVSIREHIKKEEDYFPYCKYIEYRVHVETKYRTWYVDKRYNNFQLLHEEIKKKYSPLPRFPEKRIFNMSEEIIRERKTLFTEYLNYVIQKTNFINNLHILDFLKIDKELVMLLLKYPTTINHKTLLSSQIELRKLRKKSKSCLNIKDSKYATFLNKDNTYEEDEDVPLDQIDWFIRSLDSEKEEICKNVKLFWDFLKKKQKWEHLTRNDVVKLLYGSSYFLNKSGLIYNCGIVDRNILGAQACLNLIAMLIDYETNPDCEMCISILKSSKFEHFEMMKLDKHLMSNKPDVILNAFKIIKVILNEERVIKLDQLLKDKKNIEKYNYFVLNSS